jgi:aquaporin Z
MSQRIPWPLYGSEFAGTALLVAVGLSFVILDFGTGTPVARWLPDPGPRRVLTGFLFGLTGAMITISPVGKHSGAHLNPVVTLSFWLIGKLPGRCAAGYVAAQFLGGGIGAVPLLAWGAMGRSVEFGATIPSGLTAGVAGELLATFVMVASLFFFLRRRWLRAFTPALFPLLYAVMVGLEGPVSGTSTNPARSFGPSLIAGEWRGWWVYWIGPALGAVLAVILYRQTWLRGLEIEVAKLYHFEHDPHGVFRAGRPRRGGPAKTTERCQ